MAIKQVTTLNNVRKIKIPRVGKKIFTDNEKSKLVQKLRLDGKVFTIKSVYFGKPEKKNKRLLPGSLSVLSNYFVEDRAKQALCLLALEPEWEARFESNSSMSLKLQGKCQNI